MPEFLCVFSVLSGEWHGGLLSAVSVGSECVVWAVAHATAKSPADASACGHFFSLSQGMNSLAL